MEYNREISIDNPTNASAIKGSKYEWFFDHYVKITPFFTGVQFVTILRHDEYSKSLTAKAYIR